MTRPDFPDPMGFRKVDRPGATAHVASPDVVRRIDALERGAANRDQPCLYYAKMVAANSGAPTHTNNGGWQKVGSGGGTLTWVSEFDMRPAGVSAQVDTSTNKRIDIRKTGVYLVGWGGSFSAISDGKIMDFGVYKDGAMMFGMGATTGAAATPQMHRRELASLTSGNYLELYAYQNDSASEAYYLAGGYQAHLSIQYIGPAS